MESIIDNYPDVLTVAELADLLSVCKNTAYKLICTGRIDHIRIGRSIRIPKVCVEVFLKTKTTERENVFTHLRNEEESSSIEMY